MAKKEAKRTPERKTLFLIIFLVCIVAIYALGCYPAYTGMKIKVMHQFYNELQRMELADLDDDDIETLNEFQKEKFEVMVVNETFEQIYTTRTVVPRDYINKHIANKTENFSEKATVERRQMESRQILLLRGLITQGEHSYYVYIKKDVQSGLDIIKGTVWYFAVCLTLLTVFCYLWMKKEGKTVQAQTQRSDYRLMESQREFVANISHELKTPLAVVSSQVEMLEIGSDKIDRPYYYASIREELDKMSKMVGELLDFSMLDNQMSVMEVSRVNMSELLEYLLMRYDAMFRKNEIKVNPDIAANCYVYGNQMYLERAVNNYLMNAFQHTRQGKQIAVTLRREKQSLYLEVYNDGETIMEDQMERIWDSFYTSSRKKNQSVETGKNIGLGLFVVRKIIEKHKGSCGVENRTEGVAFWIRLPAMKE